MHMERLEGTIPKGRGGTAWDQSLELTEPVTSRHIIVIIIIILQQRILRLLETVE